MTFFIIWLMKFYKLIIEYDLIDLKSYFIWKSIF